MPDFVALPYPYIDCAVVSFADVHAAEQGTRLLRQALSAFDLVVHEGAALPCPTCVLVASRELPPLPKKSNPLVFSGFGLIDDSFAFGQKRLPSSVPDIGTCVGNFTLIEMGADAVRAEHDFFGNGQFYVSQHKGCAILSNRLHLNALIMGALGLPLELNRNSCLSLLFSNHTFFSQQNMSQDMLVEGVVQVPPDKKASLKAGILVLQPKAAFLDCFSAPRNEYDDLLRTGLQEVVRNTRAVLEDKSFDTVIVDLSGGKDSRMVFGAVLQYPDWRDRIRLHTHDVPGVRDLDIAIGIANHFGASFSEGLSVPQVPFSAAQNLDLWRSYFHGLYHRIGANPWTYAGRNLGSINFSGSCGECYRAFWTPRLRKYMGWGGTVETFTSRFVRRVGLWDVMDRAHQHAISAYMKEALEQLPGRGLREKLESHYLYYRSRAHFGLRGFNSYHAQCTWFPLMSPSLLKAANSLSFADRAANRVIYDLTSRLHPLLARIEYEGKDPFSRLSWIRHLVRKLSPRVTLNTDRAAWESASKVSAARLSAAREGKKPGFAWSKWQEFVQEEAIKAYEEAKMASPVAREILTDRYIDLLRSEFASGSRKAFETASRLFAIRDSKWQ